MLTTSTKHYEEPGSRHVVVAFETASAFRVVVTDSSVDETLVELQDPEEVRALVSQLQEALEGLEL